MLTIMLVIDPQMTNKPGQLSDIVAKDEAMNPHNFDIFRETCQVVPQ